MGIFSSAECGTGYLLNRWQKSSTGKTSNKQAIYLSYKDTEALKQNK